MYRAKIVNGLKEWFVEDVSGDVSYQGIDSIDTIVHRTGSGSDCW